MTENKGERCNKGPWPETRELQSMVGVLISKPAVRPNLQFNKFQSVVTVTSLHLEKLCIIAVSLCSHFLIQKDFSDMSFNL